MDGSTIGLPAAPAEAMRWEIGPWRSANRLALLAQAVMGGEIAVLAALGGTLIAGLGMVEAAIEGTLADDGYARWELQLSLLAGAWTYVHAIAGVAVGLWLARSIGNAAARARGTGRWSPTVLRAVLCTCAILPVVGLWREIASLVFLGFTAYAIHDLRVRSAPPGVRPSAVPAVGLVLSVVGAVVVVFVGFILAATVDPTNVGDVRLSFEMLITGYAALIVPTALLLWLVRVTERRVAGLPALEVVQPDPLDAEDR